MSKTAKALGLTIPPSLLRISMPVSYLSVGYPDV